MLAAALRAGLWSGVLATVLGGLVGSYLFGGDLASPGNVTRLLLFVVVAVGVLAVTRAEEGTRRRLRSELAERERLNAELQAMLSERARNATEAQRVRDALSESEGRFRTMADATPLMVWLADTDEKPDWFNQSWLAFTGRATTEGTGGVDWAADVHPEDRGPLRGGPQEGVRRARPFEIEYRLRRADGQYRWVLDRGTPRFAPDGAFTGLIGTGLDIHDRRFVERRDRFLAQTANAMGATPDIEEAFQKVARLAVPLLADVCLIHLKDAGEHGRLRFAHHDAEREKSARRPGGALPRLGGGALLPHRAAHRRGAAAHRRHPLGPGADRAGRGASRADDVARVEVGALRAAAGARTAAGSAGARDGRATGRRSGRPTSRSCRSSRSTWRRRSTTRTCCARRRSRSSRRRSRAGSRTSSWPPCRTSCARR